MSTCIHILSVNSASDNPAKVLGKVMLLIQLGDLHPRVNFGVVDICKKRLFKKEVLSAWELADVYHSYSCGKLV